jgi:threonine/homoserine/homoserine lactone efflux protein
MEPRVFLLYLLTWTLVALTPGPAVMYSMAVATRSGFRASLGAVCGIQAGNFALFLAVAVGLGTILAAASTAFDFLRVAGAVYLVWLGARVIFGSFRANAMAEEEPRANILGKKSVITGVLVQLTNPKALLFVSALLPQFLDPQRSPSLQLTVLVLTTIAVDAVVLCAYALLACRGLKHSGALDSRSGANALTVLRSCALERAGFASWVKRSWPST